MGAGRGQNRRIRAVISAEVGPPEDALYYPGGINKFLSNIGAKELSLAEYYGGEEFARARRTHGNGMITVCSKARARKLGVLTAGETLTEFLHDIIDAGVIVLPHGYLRDDFVVNANDRHALNVRVTNKLTEITAPKSYGLWKLGEKMDEVARDLSMELGLMVFATLLEF